MCKFGGYTGESFMPPQCGWGGYKDINYNNDINCIMELCTKCYMEVEGNK